MVESTPNGANPWKMGGRGRVPCLANHSCQLGDCLRELLQLFLLIVPNRTISGAIGTHRSSYGQVALAMFGLWGFCVQIQLPIALDFLALFFLSVVCGRDLSMHMLLTNTAYPTRSLVTPPFHTLEKQYNPTSIVLP